MKTYIGTKQIQAKPMTRKAYNDLRGWAVPADENPNDDGYLVVYTDSPDRNVAGYDGYVSWSPKEVFEKAYKLGDTPIERMETELTQLSERLDKLGAFISKPKPDFLDENEWTLLQRQYGAMEEYFNILNERLTIARNKA